MLTSGNLQGEETMNVAQCLTMANKTTKSCLEQLRFLVP